MQPSSVFIPRLRRSVGAVLLALASAGAAAAPAQGPQEGRPVQDPHYGDTLFHFFQARYFTAITALMTSQHFERMPVHADEAEILRGGMLLSYGMHREAGAVFAGLIERGAAPHVRDRAWYYLAKIRYQRGFLAEAEDAIGRIEGTLPGDLDDDRRLLHANLLLARDDHAGAAAVLEGLAAREGAGRYARYNLGVALVRAGDAERGRALLDELGRARADHEEYRSLRDRANVALGFAALQDERPEDARVALQRVRLTSLHANKALLGFGWAAAALDKPQDALVPWAELAGRDPSDGAVLEARIAVPYAYAELGASGQALAGYEQAIDVFEQEGTRLDESIAAIRAGALVEGLADQHASEEMGWFWSLTELPALPHEGHLAQVLAQHDFQEAFKNYRDLQFLANNLAEWQDKLGIYDDMLANRRKAYAERLPQVREQAGRTGLAGLVQRGQETADELARALADGDGRAFADARQRELGERLARVKAQLDAAPADADLAASRAKHRLAAGVLAWELAEQHPSRAWEARKAMAVAETGLEEARGREAAIAQAQRDEPARFEAFERRIAALAPRLQALLPRVTALGQEQQRVLQNLAVAELQRQKERLATYTLQARFAVAQLYDQAKPARKEGDDAAAR